MDQINIQSFCQVQSEDDRFDLRVFRKLMPIGAHQFPTLSASEYTKYLWTRQYKIEHTQHVVNRNIPAKTSSYPGWSEGAFSWRPLSMANQSNRKYPCGPERYHRYYRHRKWEELSLSGSPISNPQWNGVGCITTYSTDGQSGKCSASIG